MDPTDLGCRHGGFLPRVAGRIDELTLQEYLGLNEGCPGFSALVGERQPSRMRLADCRITPGRASVFGAWRSRASSINSSAKPTILARIAQIRGATGSDDGAKPGRRAGRLFGGGRSFAIRISSRSLVLRRPLRPLGPEPVDLLETGELKSSLVDLLLVPSRRRCLLAVALSIAWGGQRD